MTVAKLIKTARVQHNLSLQKFVDVFFEGFEGSDKPVRATVSKWEHGTEPQPYYFFNVPFRHGDWRSELAIAVLCEISPVVGRVLKEYFTEK